MAKKTIVKAYDTSARNFRYYVLASDVMTESDNDGGKLWGELPYWLQRQTLKRVLGRGARPSAALQYRIGATTIKYAIIQTTPLGALEIGCQRFSPTQAKKLREWALK